MNIKTSTLKPHPQSKLVPDMRDDEWKEFLDDIRERGIKVPIEVDSESVIHDGHHRWRAAKKLEIAEVPVREIKMKDGEDSQTYMLKAAVLRRHLSDDQRAMISAMIAKASPLKPGPKAGEDTHSTGVSVSSKAGRNPALAGAASQMRVSITKASKAARVLAARPELARKVHQGEMKLKEAVRHIDREKQDEAIKKYKAPTGKFPVIVVDPPWAYSNRADDATHRAANPYPSMTTAAICKMDLPADKDCILWLWTTNAFMRDAFTVLDAWGFEEKTILTWVKDRMGLGDWLRGRTEHCILAIKGKPAVRLTNQTTVLEAKLGPHSRKPDEFYAMVEKLCPTRPLLEMFAREERKGWTTSGAEVKSDAE